MCIWNWGSEEEALAGVEVSVDAVSRSGAVTVAAGVNQVGEGACVSGTGGVRGRSACRSGSKC